MGFKENLKFLRENNNISQKKLADAIGVAQSSVNYWEKGKRTPSVEAVQKIADYFNVSLPDLLDRDYYTQKTKEDTKKTKIELNHLVFEIVDPVLGGNPIQDLADTNATVKYRYEKYKKFFTELNDEGQKKAIEQIELLTKIPEYRKKDAAPALNAAHDNGATPEQKKNADDIMKNPDEWN